MSNSPEEVAREIKEGLSEEDAESMVERAKDVAEENGLDLPEFLYYLSSHAEFVRFLKDGDIEVTEAVCDHVLEMGRDLGLNIRDDTVSDEAMQEINSEILETMERVQEIADQDIDERRGVKNES